MPNHVTTVCRVNGNKASIAAFLALCFVKKIEDEEEYLKFDFNTVVPMPECYRGSESSTVVDFGVFILTNGAHRGGFGMGGDPLEYPWAKEQGLTTIPEFKAWYLKNHPDGLYTAAKALASFETHGYWSWYDWSIANWGTKWNAYSFNVDTVEENYCQFHFDTAWGFPEPVFRKLAEKFPDLVFDVKSFDEGWGFACIGEFNGQNNFQHVKASDELYEAVYGAPPDRSDDEEEPAEKADGESETAA